MFEIYGKNNCIWCDRAKKLLEEERVEYEFRNLEEEPLYLAFFKEEWPGRKTVPAITVVEGEDRYQIGGYEDLVRYFDGSSTLPTSS